MINEPDPKTRKRHRGTRAILVLGIYAFLGSSLTLAGWLMSVRQLTDWGGSGISMLPNTAFAAICASGALLLPLTEWRRAARLRDLLGLLVVLIGSATLFEHISGINLGIDLLLVNPQWGSRAATSPGRMGPPASISFTLIGAALLLSRKPSMRRWVPCFGITVIAITLLSLIGYLFGADPLFSVARFTGIAMQTATILLALGLGVVATVPKHEPMRTLCQDSAAGLLARRSLPIIVMLPIVLGALRTWGQNAGLFDAGLGTALLVLALIAVLCGLLWWSVGAVALREAALREREAELQLIIDRTPFMLTRCSRDLRYRFITRAYAKLIGRPREEVGGQLISEIMGEEGFRTILPHIERVLQGNHEVYEAEVQFRGAGLRSLHVVYTPEFDEQGTVTGWIGSILDITERKQAEKELARAKSELERINQELEHRVQERTADLQEMVAELQHVSYAMVHDMRAPLRAMHAFAQFLLEDAPEAQPQTRQYCERIILAAARLDKLIQDALGYTKAVLREAPREAVDLHALVQTLVNTYPNLQPDQADIQIIGTLPAVLGSESLLTQCFSNLLGNAVKFVPRGAKPRVRVSAEPRGEMIRIWVHDNGIGIPEHARKRLFGMFERLTNEYEGTGIGLAIVRKVANRMGGNVGVESEPNDGSRFWVELQPATKVT